MGSNALNALLSKAFSERSEDFSAAQRRESIGIFVVWVGRPGGPVCRPYENTKGLSGERRRGRRPRRPAGAHYAVLRFKRIALIIRTVPLIRHAARATFP